MLQRAISGAVFVAIVVLCIWYHPLTLGALLLFVLVGGLLEFYRLSKQAGVSAQALLGVLTAVTLFASHFAYTHYQADARWHWLALPVAMLIPIVELYRNKPAPFNNIAWTFLGMCWVAVPFTLLNDFHLHPITKAYNGQVLLGYFFLLWTSDTCAYLSGRTFGRNKLFERISPGKTWEGSIGGTILTVLIAWVVSRYFTVLEPAQWMAMAAVVAVFGTLGDLVESMFKRSIGVKDSGNIMPGHGGFLDRFDGVLVSAPLVFVLFQLWG